MNLHLDADWSRLPAGLKSLPQWCIAGPDRAPYIPAQDGTIINASPVVGPWLDFQSACGWAKHLGVGIGYILTSEDPYTCIDLDIKDSLSCKKNGTLYLPEEQTSANSLEMYQDMVKAFNSYTELSASGKGVHIWVEGNIGAGKRRDGVEVYSQQRFIVCTGNEIIQVQYSKNDADVILPQVVNNQVRNIFARADLLSILVKELSVQKVHTIDLIEETERYMDKQIVEMAMHAVNGSKFTELCIGDWAKMGYRSQSEADCALLSMFTFYSTSNQQCRRLFRYSNLGKREKATRDDVYINRTLRLIRGREANDAHVAKIVKEQGEHLGTQMSAPALPAEPVACDLTVSNSEQAVGMQSTLEWPPGVLGEISKFIYNSSPRPVKDIAIAAALGLMAGIVGKSFVISKTGLNLYISLVALSGVGKETMHSGISAIIMQLQQNAPGLDTDFVIFNNFASGPALLKVIAENQCFVNIVGEWGHKLEAMSHDEYGMSAISGLRTVMTDIFQKSGPDSIVGGISYSDKDKSTAAVSGAAYSIIGESTPELFYASLTSKMMEDGFLSRFTVIEYEGDRPPLNEDRVMILEPGLFETIKAIVVQSKTLIKSTHYCPVEMTKDANILIRQWDKHCDKNINKNKEERKRQMWNRAHLKVLRIAAIIAVSNNWVTPVVTKVDFEWAIELVYQDIQRMRRHLKAGDIGLHDSARTEKLKGFIKEYFSKPIGSSYKIPNSMRESAIIPRRYMQVRSQSVNAFIAHPQGHIRGFTTALENLIDDGYIMEVPMAEIVTTYGNQGKCYRVTISLD